MNRRWLIAVSILAHVGLGVFLFATGIWKLDRLQGPRVDVSIGVMLPPAEAEGGPKAGEKPKDPVKKPPPKKTPDHIVQPEATKEPVPAVAPTSEVPGNGSGDGSGAGSGSGSGKAPCPDCIGDVGGDPDPVCGNNKIELGETCDDGNTRDGDGCSRVCEKEKPPQVAMLPPTVMGGLHTGGDSQIRPPDVVKTAMMRDGKDRVIGVVKVCIDAQGSIQSVSLIGSTKYPEYDERLLAGVRTWTYQAYRVNGTPVPACSTATFIYTQK